MGQTMTTADAALKNFYLDPVRSQINEKNVLLEYTSKGKVDAEGRYAVLSLHTKRNSSVGSRADGNYLPGTLIAGTTTAIGQQSFAEQRVELKQLWGRIQINERVLKAAKSNRGSFINVMNVETEGLANDMKKDLNRQLFGDGSGKIAQFGTTSASTTVVLHTTATTRAQLRQLEVGMKIDIGTVADPDLRGASVEILTVDFASIGAATFTVASAITTATTDFAFRAGVGAGSTTTGVELTGLASIADSAGTLFNVDPASHPRWSSYEKGSVGAITDDALIAMIQEIGYESGESPDVLLTTNGVVRSYAASLAVQKRFANSMDLKGGFKGLSVGAGNSEVGLTDDRDCPAGTLFALNSKHLMQHVAGDWEWMDLDGAIWSRQANLPSYEASLFRFHELTTDRRNSLGKLTGITDPGNV